MQKKKYSRPEISREELQQQLFEMNISLMEANDRLLEEERMRTELFANLSHDLRAPMTALASSIELLQTGTVGPEEQKRILKLMQNRTAFLQRLITDMFLLAKMENQDAVLHRQPVEAALFLEEYFYSCEADSTYDERVLTLELDDGLDCEIDIDPEMIVRVLNNFFTNAKKYSTPGSRITLGGRRCEDCVEISVADTGVGISEADLPHVFERTYRTDKARTPGVDSSGLGLAIAKKIVERHGGSVGCASMPGEGSTFTFTLPVVS